MYDISYTLLQTKDQILSNNLREDDQVSNVKLTSQAFNVLKMLFKYFVNNKYIEQEFRDKVIEKYTSQEIEECKHNKGMEKMKNKIYYLINIFFLAISILFINYTGIFQMKFTIYQFLVLILIFLIIHILKVFKIYLILLEEKIPLRVMARLYIKTTFVSTVLPYKTGELFKMYTYGNEIKIIQKELLQF